MYHYLISLAGRLQENYSGEEGRGEFLHIRNDQNLYEEGYSRQFTRDKTGNICDALWETGITLICTSCWSKVKDQCHNWHILYTDLNSPSLIFALQRSETDLPSLEFAHSQVLFPNPLYRIQLDQF